MSFELDETIPNESKAGQDVQERIIQAMEGHAYPMRDVFGVRLALEEGLVNAIKHGNRMDPTKSVRIQCSVSEDKVRVVIQDQGEGFDWKDVPDPTADENLEKPGGRGIMLMRSFMNVIEYNDSGNELTLEKLKGVDPPSDDDDEEGDDD